MPGIQVTKIIITDGDRQREVPPTSQTESLTTFIMVDIEPKVLPACKQQDAIEDQPANAHMSYTRVACTLSVNGLCLRARLIVNPIETRDLVLVADRQFGWLH